MYFIAVNIFFYFIILITAREIQCDSQRSWVEFNSSTGWWTGVAECQFDNHYNPNELSWHFQGRRIDSHAHLENEKVVNEISEDGVLTTLYIDNFSQTNVADYSCLRVTAFAQIYYSQWISSPPLLWIDSSQQVEDGDTVLITCQTFSQAELYWVLPGLDSPTITSNNITSQIEFIAQPINNYAEIKCCLKKKDDQRTIVPCSSTYINVYSAPVVKYKGANCTDDNCDLQCVFQSFPDIEPQDVFWTVCEQDAVCRNISTFDSYFDAESHQIFSEIKNFLIKPNETIICQANNLIATVAHQFYLYLNYSSPVINSIENAFDPIESNIFEINCTFKANPLPTSFSWFKQHYMQFSNGWENITEESENNSTYEIAIATLSFDTIRSTLRILNYDSDYDYANFSCCASNNYGEVSCIQTVAFLKPSSAIVNVSQSSPSNGEEVTVNCSSFGTPFPQLELVVLTESDFNYTLITNSNDYQNVSEIVMTFIADWIGNNVVNILCYSFDQYFLEQNIQPQQTSIYINNNSSIYSVSNSSSQLECIAQRANSDALLNAKWIYWSEGWTNEVNIYDNVRVKTLSPYLTELILLLNQSNFGVYTCRFSFQNSAGFAYDVDYDFHFDTSDHGANLQEECSNSEECINVYAACINETCSCPDPYVYIDATYPACFKGSISFAPCNINEQCATAGTNFYCSEDHVCDCNGVYEDVPDVESYLCLQPVKIGNSCKFYEECLLWDKFSMCVDSICNCDDEFIFNLTTSCCTIDYTPSPDPVDEGDSLSMGAIVGIIIGATAVVIMIICVVGLIVGRRRGLI